MAHSRQLWNPLRYSRAGATRNTRRAGHHLSDSSVLVCQRYSRTCVAPNSSSLGRHVRQWRCTFCRDCSPIKFLQPPPSTAGFMTASHWHTVDGKILLVLSNNGTHHEASMKGTDRSMASSTSHPSRDTTPARSYTQAIRAPRQASQPLGLLVGIGANASHALPASRSRHSFLSFRPLLSVNSIMSVCVYIQCQSEKVDIC